MSRKTKKNRTCTKHRQMKKPRQKVNKTRTLKKGGKKRAEEIRVTFVRHHTNPDVGSIISVRKGPTTYKGDYGKGEYINNFVSSAAKEFEENLAVMMKGEPSVKVKQKVYKQIYKDADAPDDEQTNEPLKCKK